MFMNLVFMKKKAVAPVVAMSLILVVAVLSVTGLSGWFSTFQSELFIDVEERGSDALLNSGIEAVIGNTLYFNSDKENLSINKISVGDDECDIPNNISLGLNKIDLTSCIGEKSGAFSVVVVTENKLYDKVNLIESDLPLISSTLINSLIGEILNFQTDETDLEIEQILVGGNVLFDMNVAPSGNYNKIISTTNAYNTYGCANDIGLSSDDDYTEIAALGFDFPFFDDIILGSFAGIEVDTNGVINFDDYDDYSNYNDDIEDYRYIAFTWVDMDTSNGGIYVCTDLGTSPDKYAVIRYVGEFYSSGELVEVEVVLHEIGTIDFNYGSVGNDSNNIVIGLSNGDTIFSYDTYLNDETSVLTDMTISYSRDPVQVPILTSYGYIDFDLGDYIAVDLVNGNQLIKLVTNKGNFTQTMDVGTLFDSCTLDGLTLNHSDSALFFTTSTVNYPTFCSSSSRVCRSGSYDGDNSYLFSSCNLLGFPASYEFRTTWSTDNNGVSSSNEIKLPLRSTGTYNFLVDWGDGNTDFISSWNQPETTHTYSSYGTKNLIIYGNIEGFGYDISGSGDDIEKLIDITQWGNFKFDNLGSTFYSAKDLQISALDAPNLTGVTNLSYMFYDADSFNQDINSWDVSGVTDMSYMFYNTATFDQPLNLWNTSSVTNMASMFRNSDAFSQNINSWNTSSVIKMDFMFYDADSFDQPLNLWITSNVVNMGSMFRVNNIFNQAIGMWDTSSVTDMSYMFGTAQAFNQPINSWNTSRVTDMNNMFSSSVFNKPIGSWDTSSVIDMKIMFSSSSFNQNISDWNTSSVTSIRSMFSANTAFSYDVGSWDMSKVTSMSYTFYNADSFNHDLSSWNVSSVIDMGGMFRDTNIFNQDLTSWCVSLIPSEPSSFASSSALSGGNKPVWGTCP